MTKLPKVTWIQSMSLPTSRFGVPSSWHVACWQVEFFTTETPKFWEVFLMSFFDVFVAGKKREAKKVLSKKLFFYVLGIWSSENLGRQSWNLSFFILEAMQLPKQACEPCVAGLSRVTSGVMNHAADYLVTTWTKNQVAIDTNTGSWERPHFLENVVW